MTCFTVPSLNGWLHAKIRFVLSFVSQKKKVVLSWVCASLSNYASGLCHVFMSCQTFPTLGLLGLCLFVLVDFRLVKSVTKEQYSSIISI